MEQISAVILSGGKSTRMGCDKAQLVYEHRTFLERMIVQMNGIEDLYVSVGMEDRYSSEARVRHIQDEYLECGPMGGIHKALTVCKNDILFVTACDMPFMDSAFAFRLLGQLTDEADAVVPVDRNGRKHVLAALYRKGTAKVMEEHLRAGAKKLTDVLEELNVVYVRFDDFISEKKLMNVNYWEQYQNILKSSTLVLSFVGYSNAGKTTIIKKLIPLLMKEGLKVAYIKHTHHEIATVQKDTENIFASGAEISCVVSSAAIQIMKKGDMDIHELIKKFDFADLILIEGYKQEDFRKILVVNEEKSMPLPPEDCLAVISKQRIAAAKHWFSKEDYHSICQFIIEMMREELIWEIR